MENGDACTHAGSTAFRKGRKRSIWKKVERRFRPRERADAAVRSGGWEMRKPHRLVGSL